MGWLFSPQCVPVRSDRVADIACVSELVLLQRYFYLINLSHALRSRYLCGELLRYSLPDCNIDGLQLVVWGSIISKVFVCHSIWSANSVCHRHGLRRYGTPDNSRNNIIVAILTLGDGWHHNHHYCPYSARHGFHWWELDINFALLRLLSHLGVVWELRVPPESIVGQVRPATSDQTASTNPRNPTLDLSPALLRNPSETRYSPAVPRPNETLR